MSLSKNTFNKGKNGLGRTLPSQDGISGFIGYVSSLAGTSLVSGQGYKLFGIADLEALGLTNSFIGETQAVATDAITIGTAGILGDTLLVQFTNYDGTVITLGTYTVNATDTTTALQAASLLSAIQTLTFKHGFIAVAGSTGSKITLTAPLGLGVYPNTKTVSFAQNIGATMVLTSAVFAGGVASLVQPLYYHAKEFFRASPTGILYFTARIVETDYAGDIIALQSFAIGACRRVGVYSTANFTTGKVTTLQTASTTLESSNYNTPLSIIATFNFSSIAISALSDLSALSSKNVTIAIGQDANGIGFKLWNGSGKTIGCVGNAIGTRSFGKVSDSIAWKGKFNVTDGVELNSVSLGISGNPLYTALTPTQLDTVDNLRYLFLIKGKTIDGTFYNNGNTSIIQSSDYAFIENNETIDKAVRLANIALEPFQNSPIVLNSDGTISDISAQGLEMPIDDLLAQMIANGEISAKQVQVPTAQNVLSTGVVNITIKIVPIAIARTFVINIGFTPKIA